MKYAKVDDAARLILTLGKGTLMAKFDIAQAYCNIPVHADDRHLLGMIWNSQLFIDTVLRLDLDTMACYQCQNWNAYTKFLMRSVTNSMRSVTYSRRSVT